MPAILVSVAAAIGSALFLLPLLSDVIALVRMPAAHRRRRRKSAAGSSRFLFLIPAHDEDALIAECVRSVQALRYPVDRVSILVVADNCSDGTAARARACGVTCLDRQDPLRRGKPHALDWALGRVNLDAHDAIVILDADAIVDPGYAAALDRLRPLRGVVAECYDDVRNPGDSAITRMAAVFSAARFKGAFALKDCVGLNIPLSDGMCIGADVLRAHPWNAFGLSEDWELYASLTAAGVPIRLAADAHLYAQEARSLRQSGSQRRRWLAGRIDALVRVGPAILKSRKISWHQKLDAAAELAAPGPAVQAAVCALLVGALWLAQAPAATTLTGALGASLLRLAAWAVVGVCHDPSPLRAAAAFAYFPVYATWRVVVAVWSVPLVRAGSAWVRTART